ncbi:hypothetical protein BH10BAC3_BH10BAC3_17120 [soil metagenome]
MKHFLLALFCFACTASLYAESYAADTIVLDSWTNNTWQPDNRTIYDYAGCTQISGLHQTWNESLWINESLDTYTHAGDNLTEDLSQQWNGTGWDNSSKSLFTYDASGNILTYTRQNWTGTAWANDSRRTNTYDVNGHIISTLSETSSDGVAWTNERLTTYTNNADGTVNIETYQSWNAGTTSWDNSYRASYTYNADKTALQEINENWDAGSSSWVKAYRITFGYDAQGRESTQLYEEWQTNAWVNGSLSTITYHGSGEQWESYVDQSWDNNAWTTTSRDDYTYDVNDNVYQRVIQFGFQGSLFNNLRYTYHYQPGCALPLKLLDFTATLSGKDVLLKWTTTEETNTSHFEIQSSKSADKFEKIGSVKAATNSNQKINYQFVDANPAALASGKLYYKLKMVDKDGKFSYSKIAIVGLPITGSQFSIFPTVVKDNLFMISNSSYEGTADVRIVDQAGRQVYTQRLNLHNTVNQSSINVSRLNKGVYYIQLITKDGFNTQKFLKE